MEGEPPKKGSLKGLVKKASALLGRSPRDGAAPQANTPSPAGGQRRECSPERFLSQGQIAGHPRQPTGSQPASSLAGSAIQTPVGGSARSSAKGSSWSPRDRGEKKGRKRVKKGRGQEESPASSWSPEELGGLPKNLEPTVPEDLQTAPSLSSFDVRGVETRQRAASATLSPPEATHSATLRFPDFSGETSAVSSEWETEADAEEWQRERAQTLGRSQAKQTTSSLADNSSYGGLESVAEEEEDSSRSYQHPSTISSHPNPFVSTPPCIQRLPEEQFGLGISYRPRGDSSPTPTHRARFEGYGVDDYGTHRPDQFGVVNTRKGTTREEQRYRRGEHAHIHHEPTTPTRRERPNTIWPSPSNRHIRNRHQQSSNSSDHHAPPTFDIASTDSTATSPYEQAQAHLSDDRDHESLYEWTEQTPSQPYGSNPSARPHNLLSTLPQQGPNPYATMSPEQGYYRPHGSNPYARVERQHQSPRDQYDLDPRIEGEEQGESSTTFGPERDPRRTTQWPSPNSRRHNTYSMEMSIGYAQRQVGNRRRSPTRAQRPRRQYLPYLQEEDPTAHGLASPVYTQASEEHSYMTPSPHQGQSEHGSTTGLLPHTTPIPHTGRYYPVGRDLVSPLALRNDQQSRGFQRRDPYQQLRNDGTEFWTPSSDPNAPSLRSGPGPRLSPPPIPSPAPGRDLRPADSTETITAPSRNTHGTAIQGQYAAEVTYAADTTGQIPSEAVDAQHPDSLRRHRRQRQIWPEVSKEESGEEERAEHPFLGRPF
ncbi:MAG: hypothetical protein MMC23_003389 [Stictis urceolatum]|nr:hypothetical protein [Stictis urceolata]